MTKMVARAINNKNLQISSLRSTMFVHVLIHDIRLALTFCKVNLGRLYIECGILF